MQHERGRSPAWRQLAIGTVSATAILVLVRVASETDWSSSVIEALVQSSLISGLIGFPILFGLQMAASRLARDRFQLMLAFACTILGAVAVISAVVPTLNWFSGSMIAPNAPGESRDDFASFLSAYFFAVYWRLAVIMGPLFVVFNWRWFEQGLTATQEFGDTVQSQAQADNTPASKEAELSETPASPEAVPESAEEWIVNKLAMPKRGALWAISSELHYLRIYTDVANDLVLMRLSDAVERLATFDGIQIHRSHWVARQGIRDLVKQDGALEVELHNGVRLPVSRANAASVRAFCKLN